MTTLTLRQKIGQLMVFGFQGDSFENISDDIKNLIETYNVGGLILFGRNIGNPENVLDLTTSLQKIAKKSGHERPLLISVDQENGMVRRLGEGTTSFPGAMLLAATRDEEITYEVGRATARELKALGINWNLAPVVDINNNPHNPVIGVRSFGETAECVSRFAKASMKGMQSEGVITTLKHFPGHGDTHTDSHLALPVITHSLESLEKLELVPFKECINEGADVVMTAHVYFPALETQKNRSATRSHKVITTLLRNKLEFDGVVTTDCMEMKAISDTIGTASGAVEAIKAGVDLIMISHLPSLQIEAIEAIVKAVENGEILESRIDESMVRVQKLKDTYLSWSNLPLGNKDVVVPKVVACDEHVDLANTAYRKGVTVVRNEENMLPLSRSQYHKVLVVYPTSSYLTLVEEERYAENDLGQIVLDIHPSSEISQTSNEPTLEEIEAVIEKSKDFDTVLVGTLSALKSEGQTSLLKELVGKKKKVVVLAMRNPYDLGIVADVPVGVSTYEFSASALKMAVKATYGQEVVTGTLPVTIPNVTS